MTAQGSFSRMICHEAHMASYDIYLVGFPHRKSDQSERVVNPGALYPSDWVHFAPRLAREANIYEFEPFSRTACTDQDTSLDSSALDSHGTCSQTSIRHDDPSDIKPGTRCNSLLGRELCAGHNDLRELRSSQALHDAARHLLDEAKLSGLSKHSGLSPNRSRWRPIIFAGHGLGGLVVKIALMIADIETHYLDVRLRTHKLILADTPHEADIATWEDVLEDMIKSSRIHIHGRRSSFLADMATSVHEMSDYFKGTLTHLVTDLPDHVEPCTGNLLENRSALRPSRDNDSGSISSSAFDVHRGQVTELELQEFLRLVTVSTEHLLGTKIFKDHRLSAKPGAELFFTTLLTFLGTITPSGLPMHHSTAWQAKSEGDASAAYVQYVSSLQPFPERRIRVTGTSAYETAALVKVMVKKVLHSSNNAICLAVFQESLQRDSLDFKTLLRFFISQIISQRPTTFSHIWPLYLHNEKLGPTSAVGVLWSYFTILLAALRDCKIVFAITEVQDDSERSFIELDELEKVLKSINSDYLIVTSAYAAVDSEFRRTDSRIDINLGPDDALRRPIIQSIVSEAIRKHTGSTKLALLHDRNAELAEITSIGQATRYAALLSRSLLLSTTNAVDDTLSIVPRSEDRMFQYCLQYMDEKLLQWCDAMISWVYRAVRPLRTQELAVAVALQLKPSEKTQLAPYISQRLERDIGLHLSPILKVEQDFVYFHAETTKKYIEKINSDPLSMRGLNIPTHGQIASICLQYLQHYLEAAASQQDEPTDDVQVEWEWRFVGCHSQQPELGLLDYAIQHWPTHYLAHIQLNDGMSFQGNKEQFSRSMEHTTSLEDSDVHSQVIRFLNADTLRNQWYKRFRCQISPDTDCNRSTTSTEVAGALGFFFDVDIYLTPDKYGYHALLGLENESRSPESANLEKLLRVTVRYGHSELVKFPLSKGAKRSDAFLAAASCGRLDLLQLLADDSIFQNTNDHLSGMAMYPAAMQLAARAGDLSCFEFCGRLTGNHEWIKQSTSFLHSAAAGGNVKILEYLWKGGNLDLDYEEDSGVSALMLATQLNQAQFAAALCKLGADTNKVNDEGETALHMAVLKDPTITEVLLQHKADARAKDKIKQTALHYACKIGNSAVVIQLIKALARDEALDAPDIHRETPLSIATAGGNAELVRLLLDAGAEASKNISNEHHEHSPLYIAASCGNLAVFKLLYSSSKLPYPFLEALFMRAIEQRQLPIVRSLLNDLKSIDFHTVRGYSPLESACGEGYIDIVRFLLQKGAHPNFADNNGHTPLHSAAKEGHEDVVRLLLEYKCDPNPRLFTERQTPLLLAVSGWHSKSTIVKILLDSGADVHVQDVNGNTASHLAVAWPDAVDILLSYDPKLDTLNHGGETPLHRAVKDHHTRTVKLLVKKDPALIHVCDERELTPIHYAIEQSDWYKHDISILEFLCSIDGFKFDQSCYRKRPPILMALGWPNLAAARFLLSKRPDLAAAKSEGNMSALHIAAVKDLVEIVDALFDASSDIEIEARTDEGYTPLHLASQYGGPMMIRKLLEHHADVNAVSPNGDTALTEACYRRRIDNLEFVNTLLQAGANCNLREAHKAPLLLAVDKPLVVEELLKHGANVDGAVDADDKTPLMAAASGNHRQCLDSVRLLLGWKADVEIRDRSGSTALHMAAHADNPLRYKILLDAGANPSVIDNAGQTPLHRAVLFCSPESRVAKVEMLLERGAIINVVDGVGYTPLHIVAGLGTEYGHRLLELITNIYLSQSLDLDGNDEAKQTPLHRALDDGYSYAVKHLIRNGAQLRNQEQRSCLEIAAGSNRERDEKIKCLLESGQWTSTDKVKALLVASKKDLGTALILAKHDAGMFESENETFAVLYDCLRTNRPKEAGTFLELGANPFRSQSGQLSPFQIAYLSDDDEMFETFLKGCENKLKGSSPDQRAIFQALRCAFETTKRERTEEFSRWRARHTYRTMTDEDGWSMAHYDDHYHLGNLWSDHQRLYPVPLAPTKLVIPSYWVLNETISRGHDLLHVEDRTAYYKGIRGNSPASARSDHPLLPRWYQSTPSYFEIEILPSVEATEATPIVSIGLCGEFVDLSDSFPGESRPSTGYHSDDGRLHDSRFPTQSFYAQSFGVGDTVGCGIRWNRKLVYFTKNGESVGSVQSDMAQRKCYPVVTMSNSPCAVKVNFGSDGFKYSL